MHEATTPEQDGRQRLRWVADMADPEDVWNLLRYYVRDREARERRLARADRVRRWWRRNVVGDAPPYTDDQAERYRARQRRPVPLRCKIDGCTRIATWHFPEGHFCAQHNPQAL